MWILILTMMIDTNNYAGVSGVESVNFNYESNCEKAGAKWLSTVNKKYGDKSRSFYICVKG